MHPAIIVEGKKNDKSRLKRLLHDEVSIYCTFGTLNTHKLESLRKKKIGEREVYEVYLFMDNDPSGKKNPERAQRPFSRCGADLH